MTTYYVVVEELQDRVWVEASWINSTYTATSGKEPMCRNGPTWNINPEAFQEEYELDACLEEDWLKD